ncbi:FAD-dependent oxidoreductase [Candidatus Nomurabacteria bacterium]|nr:FAD-dependent oxidoreductase [Candidatus Nomurabacteria bacterium]
MKYDLAIIGGGPAGVAAGVYAARKKLKTVVIAESFGGQSVVSENIENWIGTPNISGLDLAKSLKNHLEYYSKDILDIKEGEKVDNIEKKDGGFVLLTSKESYEAKTILIATGSHRKKLQVPGADKFEHKGVTYCASCDGPIFEGKDVVVVGGGNAGFESASQLLAYCKSVTLLHKNEDFNKADPVTVKKVLSNPKMKAILNAEILEVRGDKFVEMIVYKNKETGDKVELPTAGIFVEIGSVPTTYFASHLVKMTESNSIVVDPRNQKTSCNGVWAAGDCTDGLYHQNNIAAGDAVRALEDIYYYLNAR